MLPSGQFVHDHAHSVIAAAGGVIAVGAVAAYVMNRRKVSPEVREERRRQRLAQHGRIIDGTLIDTAPHLEVFAAAEAPPQALIYRYRIAGVTYECGQNISMLTPLLPDLGLSSSIFGMPVQVRYDRDNPADSIIIAETWNGLWHQNADSPDHS